MGNALHALVREGKPELISYLKKFFVQDRPNKAGVYSVNAWVGGKRRTITVDDQLLLKKIDSNGFFKSEKDNGKVWSYIADKAFAKAYLTYQQASK